MHHDHLVSDSTKFNSISKLELATFSGLKAVIRVVGHVPHDEPQFLARTRLLLFSVFDGILVVYPVIIVLQKTYCNRFFVILYLKFLKAFLIGSHLTKVRE